MLSKKLRYIQQDKDGSEKVQRKSDSASAASSIVQSGRGSILPLSSPKMFSGEKKSGPKHSSGMVVECISSVLFPDDDDDGAAVAEL